MSLTLARMTRFSLPKSGKCGIGLTASGTFSDPDLFRTNVQKFAETVRTVVVGSLGDEPESALSVVDHLGLIEFERFDVSVNGKDALAMELTFGCRPDSTGKYIAVTKSKFSIWPSKRRVDPLFRLDYRDDMLTAPSAHWQVYGERGDLVLALALGRTPRSSLGAMHLPVGGSRFRPCLEDFIQFAIEECGVDGMPGYRKVLDDGRRRWRTTQLRTAVRDALEIAASELVDAGYSVQRPQSGPGATRDETLTKW